MSRLRQTALRIRQINAIPDISLAVSCKEFNEASLTVFYLLQQSLEQFCRTPNGFSGIRDVYDVNTLKDNTQQSFFLAETLKYLYLIFSEAETLPLDEWVILFKTVHSLLSSKIRVYILYITHVLLMPLSSAIKRVYLSIHVSEISKKMLKNDQIRGKCSKMLENQQLWLIGNVQLF